MTSREQFEIWVNMRPLSKLIGFCEREGDGYVHLQHTALWDAWQASRDVIEVELPTYVDTGTGDTWEHGYDNAIDDCKNNILAVGIAVKGGRG